MSRNSRHRRVVRGGIENREQVRALRVWFEKYLLELFYRAFVKAECVEGTRYSLPGESWQKKLRRVGCIRKLPSYTKP